MLRDTNIPPNQEDNNNEDGCYDVKTILDKDLTDSKILKCILNGGRKRI
jgi:hypothetical protein